jgi:hypothetical protein
MLSPPSHVMFELLNKLGSLRQQPNLTLRASSIGLAGTSYSRLMMSVVTVRYNVRIAYMYCELLELVKRFARLL